MGKAARNAQVKRFFAFFLLGSFLESRTFSAESQFDDLWPGRNISGADAYDFLHIYSFGSDETTRHLKLLVVGDLDVISTRILGLAVPKTSHVSPILIIVRPIHVLRLIASRKRSSPNARSRTLHWHEGQRLFEVSERLMHIFLLKLGERTSSASELTNLGLVFGKFRLLFLWWGKDVARRICGGWVLGDRNGWCRLRNVW